MKRVRLGALVAEQDSLYKEFKDLVLKEGLKLSDSLKVITRNPVKSLKLYPKKVLYRLAAMRISLLWIKI